MARKLPRRDALIGRAVLGGVLIGLAILLRAQETGHTRDESVQRGGTVLFAVGAGAVDSWDTEFEVRTSGSVRIGLHPPPAACPGSCFDLAVVIETPKGGIGTAAASEVPFARERGLWTFSIYTVGEDGLLLRPVRATARIVNRARPEQTAELPLVDSRTLMLAQRSVLGRGRLLTRPTLTFPVRREPGQHTNLIAASIEGGEDFFLHIDILDVNGGIARTFAPRGHMIAGQAEVFANVLSTLPDDFDGSIRITRLSPAGLFWATLANVYADGRLELLAPTTGMTDSGGAP